MTSSTRTRLTALAAAAALAVLGVATAQTLGTTSAAPAAEPTIEIQLATPATAAPESAPATVGTTEPLMEAPPAEPLPQRIVIIAEPEPVAEPAGLTAPLDRAGVQAEFTAMRNAGVLVPSGEVGDTEETAQRRATFHQGQADDWVAYQTRLAEVRWANQQALEQQAARDRAREAELQADQPEPAAVAPAAPVTLVN